MGLKQRLERSDAVAGLLGRISAGYLRLCRATTRWDRQGFDALAAALADGPAIMVTWHDGALLGPMLWPLEMGPLTTLRDTSPSGRVSGALQARLGLLPIAMEARASNRAASRAILRRVNEGVSIGLTADGPKGPARQMKPATLDWARVTGRPVFVFAAATRRHHRMDSWDRMIMPLPFSRGRVIFRLWRDDLPRKADEATLEALRLELTAALEDVSQDVWRGLG